MYRHDDGSSYTMEHLFVLFFILLPILKNRPLCTEFYVPSSDVYSAIVAFVCATGSRKREKLIERKGIAPLDLVGKMSGFIKENKRRTLLSRSRDQETRVAFFFTWRLSIVVAAFIGIIFNVNF